MKLNRITITTITLLFLGFTLGLSEVRADSGIPKNYPLKTCPVSGDKLSEHGKSVKATAPDGTVVYLCCNDCLKDFKKEPEKYAKMVKDAARK
jgi:YHS domain-containing protein